MEVFLCHRVTRLSVSSSNPAAVRSPFVGMRSGTTFKKRQKETARIEKARDKAAKREQRKLEKGSESASGPTDEELIREAMNRVASLDEL